MVVVVSCTADDDDRRCITLASLYCPMNIETSHSMFSSGRCLYSARHAPSTPSSNSSALRMEIEFAWNPPPPPPPPSSSSVSLSRASRFSETMDRDREGMEQGLGPSRLRCTISPQKNWSPKNGQIHVGHPKRSPAAVVPGSSSNSSREGEGGREGEIDQWCMDITSQHSKYLLLRGGSPQTRAGTTSCGDTDL